jgi:hypothetical protein
MKIAWTLMYHHLTQVNLKIEIKSLKEMIRMKILTQHLDLLIDENAEPISNQNIGKNQLKKTKKTPYKKNKKILEKEEVVLTSPGPKILAKLSQ